MNKTKTLYISNNVAYGSMTHDFRPYLRDRVLRLTLCSISIFKVIDEVFIALSSFSKFISFIGRLRGRLHGRFSAGVLSLSRATVNTCLVLYIITLFIRIFFPLIYFFYIFKSIFYLINYFVYNILIALNISAIRVIRSV